MLRLANDDDLMRQYMTFGRLFLAFNGEIEEKATSEWNKQKVDGANG